MKKKQLPKKGRAAAAPKKTRSKKLNHSGEITIATPSLQYPIVADGVPTVTLCKHVHKRVTGSKAGARPMPLLLMDARQSLLLALALAKK